MYDTNYLEIIVVDNGSDDGTQKYIEDLEIPDITVKKVLNKKNDYPYCLRRAKNQAREVANGDYFIDTPTDHLYVVKSHWLKETIDYLESEEEKISCVCHYAFASYRFNKANNRMILSKTNDDFFVSQEKGYSDYHVMSRKVYEDVGKYREDLAFTPNAEDDYMSRCFEKGYKRALRKFPVVLYEDIGGCVTFGGPYRLIKPISGADIDTLRASFNEYSDKHLTRHKIAMPNSMIHPEGRPMSNEDLVEVCLQNKNIQKV
jgi:glycosyltransferase involved in cell wall biosynthesis